MAANVTTARRSVSAALVNAADRLFLIRWILLIDVFLVAVTVILSAWGSRLRGVDFRFVAHALYRFDLAAEMNVAVWWSAVSIFHAGLLLAAFGSRRDARVLPWFSVSAILVLFAVDELGSFHERLFSLSPAGSGFFPFVIVALILVVSLVYALSSMVRVRAWRASVKLLVLGFALYGSVVGQEYLEVFSSIGWSPAIRVGLEEGSELAGTLCLYLALVGLFGEQVRMRRTGGVVNGSNSPFRRTVRWGMTLGLVLHMALIFLYVPTLADLDQRGNPAAAYPAFVFFLALCLALDRIHPRQPTDPPGSLALPLLLALGSVLSATPKLPLRAFASLVGLGPPAVATMLITANIALWLAFHRCYGRGAQAVHLAIWPSVCAVAAAWAAPSDAAYLTAGVQAWLCAILATAAPAGPAASSRLRAHAP